jgi:hypothetical protein
MRHVIRLIGLIVIAGLLLALTVHSAAAQTTMLAEVDRLAWNADGTVLGMTGSGASGSEFQFWEVPPDVQPVPFGPAPIPESTPTHIRTIETNQMPSLAWHPTEPGTVAITSFYGDVQVLDVFTGERLASMQSYDNVRDLDWNPDGTLLALGVGTVGQGIDAIGSIEVRDRAGELVERIEVGPRWVSRLAWNANGTHIAFDVSGGYAGVWEVGVQGWIAFRSPYTYEDEFGNPLPGHMEFVTWSPSGDQLILTEGFIYIYKSEDFELDSMTSWPQIGRRESVSWNASTDMIAARGFSGIVVFHIDYPDYAATFRSDPVRAPSEADWNPVTGQLAFYLDSTLHVLTPPTADAGPDQTAQADSSGYANVALDGTVSVDPDGYSVSYTWHLDDSPVTGPAPTLSLPEGEHTIVLVVTDIDGMIAVDTVTITVEIPPASAKLP